MRKIKKIREKITKFVIIGRKIIAREKEFITREKSTNFY